MNFKRILLRTILIFTLTIAIAIVFSLFYKQQIFRFFLSKKLENMTSILNADELTEQAALQGFNSVYFPEIIYIKRNDTLYADSVIVEFIPLNQKIKLVTIKNFYGQITLDDYLRDTKGDYFGGNGESMMKMLFDAKLNILNSDIAFVIDSVIQSFQFENISFDKNRFTVSNILDTYGGKFQAFGKVNFKKKLFKLDLRTLNNHKIFSEYLNNKVSADFSTKKINIDLKEGLFLMVFNDFGFYHKKAGKDTLKFEKLEFDIYYSYIKSYLEIKPGSKVKFNSLEFSPEIRLSLIDSSLELKILADSFHFDSLIESMPEQMVSHLKGFKSQGHLTFKLNTFLDFKTPDSTRLNASIVKHDFKVLNYGGLGINKFQDSFIHYAIKNNEIKRSFLVGNGNPDFLFYHQIPDILIWSVLYSEDGLFFYHNGFIEEAIRYAIADNIKRGEVYRGGSTVSMQLVKNLFLQHDKTISRKFEEYLITWLIEDQRLLSKERMLEIYFNIIEWGPNIYGASEASKFYFNKNVKDLTVSEAIFMASVIPRPAKFYYSFDKEGKLHDYYVNYFDVVGGRLLKHGHITEEEYSEIGPLIQLKGPASGYIKIKQNREQDSISKKALLIKDHF